MINHVSSGINMGIFSALKPADATADVNIGSHCLSKLGDLFGYRFRSNYEISYSRHL